MTRKIHLRRNKAHEERALAACAARSIIPGKCVPNGRRTYTFMSSEIVSYADFKNVSAEKRCLHCMDAGLELKNRQRKAKGLRPVEHLFDAPEKKEA